MSRGADIQSARKVLRVLNLLMRHFTHGLSPTDIARATGLPPHAVTRAVATLGAEGNIERIPETGRIRPSVRYANEAVAILAEIDRHQQRLGEIRARLSTHTH